MNFSYHELTRLIWVYYTEEIALRIARNNRRSPFGWVIQDRSRREKKVGHNSPYSTKMLSSSLTRLVSRAAVSLRAYSTASKSVIEVTDATFQQEVIEASHKTPVVLDLWAPYVSSFTLLFQYKTY